jgi:hypothetical protein
MKSYQLYPKATKEISEKRAALAPEITEAFHNFSKAVFKEGALSEKQNEYTRANHRRFSQSTH